MLMTRRTRCDGELGSMLIVALGVLALLAVFGVAFASMMSLERSAVSNYRDQVHAQMIAKAGMQRAIAQLRHQATQQAHESIRDDWHFSNRTAALDDPASSQDPSFAFVDGSGTPVRREGADPDGLDDRFISGTMGGTTDGANFRECYSLKILDAASMLDLTNLRDRARLEVDHANPDVGGTSDTDAHRMLRILLEEREVDRPEELATTLLEREAPIPHKEALRSALGTFYGNEGQASTNFRRIRDHVTTFAWTDEATIRARWDSAGGTWYQTAMVQEARSPVNVNTAPRAILVASLAGIRGTDIEGGTHELTRTKARSLAEAIANRRRGRAFRSWHDFRAFVRGRSALTREEQDLVLANANPNADLNKFAIDPKVYKRIDKADLRRLSTEFCFSSMGIFEITSLGTLYAPSRPIPADEVAFEDGESIPDQIADLEQDEIVAEQLIQSVVQVYRIYRDTSQADFEDDRFLSEPEMELRHPGILSLPGFSQDLTRRRVMVDLPWSDSEEEERPYLELPVDPATWDGQLILNGLVNYWSFAEDMLLGFNRDRTGDPDGSGFFTAHDTHQDPTVMIPPSIGRSERPNSEPDPSDEHRDHMVRAHRATDDDVEKARFDLLNRQDDRLTPSQPLFEGSDLTSLGVIFHRDRGRFLEYLGFRDAPLGDWQLHPNGSGQVWENPFMYDNQERVPSEEARARPRWRDYHHENVHRDFGSIEFWVQLLHEPRRGGFGGGTRRTLFEISDDGGAQRMALYIENGNLKLVCSHASRPVEIDLVSRNDTIRSALSDDDDSTTGNPNELWEPGRWHHVVINYGYHRPEPNSGVTSRQADMRLFIDGQFEGRRRYRNFPGTGLIIIGPNTAVRRQNQFRGFNFLGQGAQLYLGAKRDGSSHADAVIDNFTSTHIYRNRYQARGESPEGGFPPPQRFHDGSFTGYGMLYSKRLRNVEQMGLVLGTMSWTGYMDNHEVRRVQEALESGGSLDDSYIENQAANLVLRLQRTRDDGTEEQVGYGSFYHTDDQWVDDDPSTPDVDPGYTGPPTPGADRDVGELVHYVPLGGRRIFDDERLSYEIGLTPSPSGTVLQSPVLDDVTITYLPTPSYLYVTDHVIEE